MAKKEPKTNAMRILEKQKIRFEIHRYECEEFTDGVAIADMLGQPYDKVFKTLVTEGKSRQYKQSHRLHKRRLHCHRDEKGLPHCGG